MVKLQNHLIALSLLFISPVQGRARCVSRRTSAVHATCPGAAKLTTELGLQQLLAGPRRASLYFRLHRCCRGGRSRRAGRGGQRPTSGRRRGAPPMERRSGCHTTNHHPWAHPRSDSSTCSSASVRTRSTGGDLSRTPSAASMLFERPGSRQPFACLWAKGLLPRGTTRTHPSPQLSKL